MRRPLAGTGTLVTATALALEILRTGDPPILNCFCTSAMMELSNAMLPPAGVGYWS